MKKLIPALCMLLVAAALMGTSTFAWFSMNTQVAATGMQVKATTSKNLVISNNSTKGEGEAASATSSFSGIVTLSPASTQTLASTQNFFKVNGEKIDYTTGAMKDGAAVTAATPVTSGTTGEVVKHTFYIRVDGATDDTFSKLYVSGITLSTSSRNITKALRVGVVSGSYGYIYAPVNGATVEYKGLVSAGTYGTNSVVADENVTLTAVNTDTATLGAVSSSAYTTVDVYIWYEGQDENCTSANSVNVEEVVVTVSFTAA